MLVRGLRPLSDLRLAAALLLWRPHPESAETNHGEDNKERSHVPCWICFLLEFLTKGTWGYLRMKLGDDCTRLQRNILLFGPCQGFMRVVSMPLRCCVGGHGNAIQAV
jgi:hypothetical protein